MGGLGGGSIGETEFGQKKDKGESEEPPPDALLVLSILAGKIDGGDKWLSRILAFAG